MCLYYSPCEQWIFCASCLSLDHPFPPSNVYNHICPNLGMWGGEFSTLLGERGASSQSVTTCHCVQSLLSRPWAWASVLAVHKLTWYPDPLRPCIKITATTSILRERKMNGNFEQKIVSYIVYLLELFFKFECPSTRCSHFRVNGWGIKLFCKWKKFVYDICWKVNKMEVAFSSTHYHILHGQAFIFSSKFTKFHIRLNKILHGLQANFASSVRWASFRLGWYKINQLG